MCFHKTDRIAYMIFSPISLNKYSPIPLSKALIINIEINAVINIQLIFSKENLSTSLPVKNGTTSPVILPNEEIKTAMIIRPTGHDNFFK